MTTETPTLEMVIARLTRVEAQNRNLKRFLFALVLVVGAVLLMGQAEPNHVVEARKFVLTDAEGKTRALLDSNEQGGTNLVLIDVNGKQRVNLGMTQSDTLLSLLDANEKVRTMLGTDNAHGTFLAINGPNGHKRALLIDDKKGVGVSFFGPGEKTSTSLGEDASGSALVLRRPDLTEGIVLSAKQGDASIDLIDQSNLMATLGNSQAPGPGEVNRYTAASFVLYDKKGQVLFRMP
ncbi:MAG: hypothetical protein LAO31_03635 [Acidobacteriia bacterium]|nr:hypothetical protein [Terriglobia bacterium]